MMHREAIRIFDIFDNKRFKALIICPNELLYSPFSRRTCLQNCICKTTNVQCQKAVDHKSQQMLHLRIRNMPLIIFYFRMKNFLHFEQLPANRLALFVEHRLRTFPHNISEWNVSSEPRFSRFSDQCTTLTKVSNQQKIFTARAANNNLLSLAKKKGCLEVINYVSNQGSECSVMVQTEFTVYYQLRCVSHIIFSIKSFSIHCCISRMRINALPRIICIFIRGFIF